MPSIHVVYDPNDRIAGLKPSEMKAIGASAASMAVNTVEIDTETIQQTAEQLTALLLSAIAADQQ